VPPRAQLKEGCDSVNPLSTNDFKKTLTQARMSSVYQVIDLATFLAPFASEMKKVAKSMICPESGRIVTWATRF
jgi:hypothetical protein